MAYLRPDGGAWGFDDEPQPRVEPQDRDALEAALRAQGYEIRALTGLANLFLDPPRDPASALAAETS